MYQAVGQNPAAKSTPIRDGIGFDEHRTSPRSGRLSYKPPAIRFLCISVFLACFLCCVGLIEWVISDTNGKPTSESNTSTSTTSLDKRELTTITTHAPLTCESYSIPFSCMNKQQYDLQIASADAVWNDLCSTYSRTYPYYTDHALPATLQAPFTRWTSAFSAQQDVITAIQKTSKSCLYDPNERCSDHWFMYNSRKKIYTLTVGCSTTVRTVQPPCWGEGGPKIQSGTITTTEVMVCGAVMASQLLITTDIVRTSTITTVSSAKLLQPEVTSVSAQQSPTATIATATGTVAIGSKTTIISSVSSLSAPSSSQLQIGKPSSTTLSSIAIIQIVTTMLTSSKAPSSSAHTTSQLLRVSTVPTISQLQIATPSTSSSQVRSTQGTATSSTTSSESASTTQSTSRHGVGSAPSVSQLSIGKATTTLRSTSISSSSNVVTTTSLVDLQPFFRPNTSTSRVSEFMTNASDIVTSSSTMVSIASKTISNSTIAVTRTDTATKGDSTIAFSLAKNEMIVERPFTWWTYFAAMFLPALIAVVIKSMWEIIANSLKLIEPFERLTQSTAVTAEYSILTQYLEGMVSFDILRALSRGRMVPICSALIYIMVEVAPLVASISGNVRPRQMCLNQDNQYLPCDPAWVVNIPLLRLLEGFLILCIVLVICLMWLSRKSRIQVATNPSSIASLAALLNYEPLLGELQKIDPDADGQLFSTALKTKLFRLAEHYDPKMDQTRFGFVSFDGKQVSNEVDDTSWLPFTASGVTSTGNYKPVKGLPREDPWKARSHSFQFRRYSYLWTSLSLHLLTTSALFTIILTYWLDPNLGDAFNRFFNGDSVPAVVPKIILIGLAVLVDIQMKHLERIIRITEPFRRLALRNGRPETTILLPLNGTCWSNLPRNIYLLLRYEFSEGRMIWATLVGLVACLSDLNIIAVAGLLWNLAQTNLTYRVCGYLSMACTSAILLIVIVTMVWWLHVPVIRRMPRQPDNIGNILSYLCGSELVRDWNSVSLSAVPIENLNSWQRDDLIRGSGRRFCFGRMLGVDDRERWCIDFERNHGQVMVVNEPQPSGFMSMATVPERWQSQSRQIKRKPLSTTARQMAPGWESALIGGRLDQQGDARYGRFPSLRANKYQPAQQWDDQHGH